MAVNLRYLPEASVLRDILARCSRRHGVPGAQLVVHRHGRSVGVAMGEQEYGGGRTVDAATAFPVGSVTKAFTATTLLVLVADGDLELDEPVGLYVPGLVPPAADLTVRQVLSHTGGLPAGPAADESAETSPQRYLRRLCRPEQLVLAPGSGFSYSNVGYVLAGEVLAALTGMSWAEAVTSIVLRPLGISGGVLDAPGGRAVATGHAVDVRAGRTRPVGQSLMAAEMAAGGLALSAADLVRLGRLHVDDAASGVLPASAAAQMRSVTRGAVPYGLADGWGPGLAMFHGTNGDWYGHDGNGDGTGCHLRIDPTDGWVVALTANASTSHAMWSQVAAELQECGIPLVTPAPATVPAPVRSVSAYLGAYHNGDLEYLVTDDGRGARLSVDGDDAECIEVRADGSFRIQDAASGRWSLGGRFISDSRTGAVTGIQLGGRVGSRRPVLHG